MILRKSPTAGPCEYELISPARMMEIQGINYVVYTFRSVEAPKYHATVMLTPGEIDELAAESKRLKRKGTKAKT